MQLIVSPAKKMKQAEYGLPPHAFPYYKKEGLNIIRQLSGLTIQQLQDLYRCSTAIARDNYARLQNYYFDNLAGLTPALFCYNGIQYQAMGAQIMTVAQYEWLERHLFILSAVFGALRPFDGVCPYRLEMGSSFFPEGNMSLTDFWRPRITSLLLEAEQSAGAKIPCVINLASAEYAKAVLHDRFLWVDVYFYRRNAAGKLKESAVWCKKARGAMVNLLADIQAQSADDLRSFTAFDFKFKPELSDERHYVFVQGD